MRHWRITRRLNIRTAAGRVAVLVAPVLIVAVQFIVAAAARGDVFVLHTGGQVRGELLNPKESPREKYVVKTATGKVTLDASQVKEIKKLRKDELEYERIRGNYPSTVDGQWRLAEWCRERHLTSLRRQHLHKIIEIEPEHAAARRALGHRKLEGVWKTEEQFWTERGYVRNGSGRWMLPQQIEVEERERKDDLARKEWRKRMTQWRKWLDGDKAQDAALLIQEVDDPYAEDALDAVLEKEEVVEYRKLFMHALGRINTPSARKILAEQALNDANEDLRLTCLEILAEQPDAEVVAFFVGKLRNKDNILVNRAAVGLAYMRDTSAISPLINALITTHTFKIVSGQPGGMGASFDKKGGLNSFGSGASVQIVKQHLRNPQVLEALVHLTKRNFEYNVEQWKSWFVSEKRARRVDVGRN